MSDNIQTNTARHTPPCLQHQIEKTRYLIEVHFSETSAQNVEDRLKRVILHDLEHLSDCILNGGSGLLPGLDPLFQFRVVLPEYSGAGLPGLLVFKEMDPDPGVLCRVGAL